ncbi:hypothetical protein J7384_05900 [Endozoicomonas sp. G2_1]|uniref:hypothetical protein n=1 Tax=Endozoicomonas sp. G2_1 TaxID=2821091 RepID=UPI001AD9C241|nr:hypothetical protein [Endozoicomonas sp. G2_1]MBO9489890.1 hypothetical protein [Endozoicomonas sp. G2_1]
MNSYQIVDEPRASRWSKKSVDPMWPLLAFMLGGAIFSWLWYALNSIALNSSSRNKELFIIGAALLVFTCMYIGLGALIEGGALADINIQYIKICITSIELIFCYKLYLMQQPSFDLYEYFNGDIASPAVGLVLALLAGKKVEIFIINLLLTGAA